MESALALPDGSKQLLPHSIERGVIGQFEVVHTCHDAGEIVVRHIRWFAWFADHCEHRRQTLEPYVIVSVDQLFC